MAATLESAIAPHLRVQRTQAAKTPESYQPPFPAYTARFPESTKDIVMAIIGAQALAGELDRRALDPVLGFIRGENKQAPSFWEIASVTDNQGYWKGREDYEQWSTTSGFAQWSSFPSVDRFETVFSNNEVPEGAAHMREGVSGQIQEHVYWGSMRDRLAVAQTDAIEGQKYSSALSKDSFSRRIRVPGRPNAAVIRSGQDWSNTKPKERTLYLETMHPVLTDGMHFLRDQGDEVGCYSCRFMDVLDASTLEANLDRTFGLEQGPSHAPAHFGGFLKYAKDLENDVSLRLFHEVLVLQPGQQFLEYIGCHPKTGFLVGHSS
ncbi:heme-containing dehydratase protein [Roridomyces roridus]|uniref:Heme-containing dehydratase protein n=1 Tax=Roridomyces roridus TaxID=1738132 RepID=A0AAD7BTG1_9AGAR|nr:heme-containing dehydratase protein [Roridomyces roridus]